MRPVTTQTLAPTVLLARDGSREALEALVRAYQKPLYYLCYRYVQDHDAAADVAQRSFIRAMDSLHLLRDAEQFQGWLFRIAINIALNHLRDRPRFVRAEQQPDLS